MPRSAPLQLANNRLPDALRPLIAQVLKEIDDIEEQVKSTDRSLKALMQEDAVVQRMRTIPRVGLIVSTGMRAAIPDINRFPSGRHLSAWLGITAREHSSGETRRLGKISKQGDVYLRTQLIHGARSMLFSAKRAQMKERPLDRFSSWALKTEQRVGHNKAAAAVANKLARMIWACWTHERDYDGNWSVKQAQTLAPPLEKAA
jgi:transposase